MLMHSHNRKNFSFSTLIFVTAFMLCFFLLQVHPAYAQADIVGGWLVDGLAGLIYPLALGIGGLFIGIGGLALDLTLQHLVVGMGGMLKGGFGLGIVEVWQIIRDVFNILFIFSFIFLGIKTILNAEDSGTKRALGHLIIAALFINFSLLITQVVIDFSNIAATQLYNLIITGGGGTGIVGSYGDGSVTTQTNSISGAFMEIGGLGSFFGDNSIGITGVNLILYSLLMMIFFILAGIIFLFATYHVIYRFVALSIYMILSPVLFLGMILPNFKKFTDMWIGGLLRQSFFAPAFLFLLYVSIISLQRLKGVFVTNEAVGYTTIVQGSKMTPDGFTIFIFFAIVIGFLYASVKVGDMMGISGAGAVVKGIHGAAKNARGTVQSLAYRNTAGRALHWGVKRIDKLDQLAESEKGTSGRRRARLARTILGGESTRRALEKGSNFSAGGTSRADAEKMDKERTQRATRSNQIKKISDTLTSGGTSQKERAIADASNAQLLEMLKDKEGKALILANAGKLSASQAEAIEKSDEIDDVYRGQLATTRGQQIADRLRKDPKTGTLQGIEEVIGKADVSDLKAMGFKSVLPHAGKLSAKQIDDWKDLTPSEKSQIKELRKSKLREEFGVDTTGKLTGANADDLFKRIKVDEERSKLPDDILKHAASAKYLNTNVLTKIVENPGITDTDRSDIKKAVTAHHAANKIAAEITKYKDYFEKNNAGQRY